MLVKRASSIYPCISHAVTASFLILIIIDDSCSNSATGGQLTYGGTGGAP